MPWELNLSVKSIAAGNVFTPRCGILEDFLQLNVARTKPR